LVFDLGLKRDFSGYTAAQQHHISRRQPTSTSPDTAESLRNGGVKPEDIEVVVLSHVHWDHVGTPSDFPNATFVVGSGTLDLLAHGGGYLYPKELFHTMNCRLRGLSNFRLLKGGMDESGGETDGASMGEVKWV
jgi:glyoxylase-like metal-dependent hydrolase (beta-lactamase superfamily II)